MNGNIMNSNIMDAPIYEYIQLWNFMSMKKTDEP